MLFLAPHPPVLVPRSRALVLGRGAECDVPIPTPRASRNHAEVCFSDEQVVVRDLDSTNGTFVNGERIGEDKALRPGDRIGIGGAEVIFCRVVREGALAAGQDDDATIVCQDPDPEVGRAELLRGDLSQIPVTALLQMLAEEQMTGSVAILSGENSARIWLERGRPVHAQTNTAEGIAAAVEICGLRSGRFLCADGAEPPDRTLDMNATELLLEASRQVDESGAQARLSQVRASDRHAAHVE